MQNLSSFIFLFNFIVVTLISAPYILEADKINYYSEKPVTKVVVTDVMYEFNKAKYEKKPPQNLNKLSVINRSHIPQNIAKTVEYTTTSTSGWSFGVGIGIGQCLKSLGRAGGIFGPRKFSSSP